VRIYELAEIHSITAHESRGCIVHRAFSSDFVSKSFRSVVERITSPEFIRVARTALVNLNQITSIEPLPGGHVLINLANGQQLSAPPSFAARVYRAFQRNARPRRKRA
jgi:DNA-binding LytR/AlgR family response regulator